MQPADVGNLIPFAAVFYVVGLVRMGIGFGLLWFVGTVLLLMFVTPLGMIVAAIVAVYGAFVSVQGVGALIIKIVGRSNGPA